VRRYVLRRVLQMIPLLAGVSLLVFVLLASAPGDPVDMLIRSNPSVTVNDIARLKHLYGLDQPIIVRYAKWLERTLRGDLGWSLAHQVPVARLVGERLPNSLMLVGTGIVIAILVAVPAGIYSALRQYSVADYLASLGTFVGFSIPVFWRPGPDGIMVNQGQRLQLVITTNSGNRDRERLADPDAAVARCRHRITDRECPRSAGFR